MLTKYVGLIIIGLLAGGCGARISPEASSVQIHSQVSNILDDCKKLGPVRVRSTSAWSPANAERQARADLRQAAYDKYKADTVVLVNIDSSLGFAVDEAYANGIAYRCFK